MHTLLLTLHVASAVVALMTGLLAYRYPNGSPAHRRAGRGYIWAWGLFAPSGLWLGAARPALSPFEIITLLGLCAVIIGVVALRRKRQLGPVWRHHHLRWMIISYAFVVVATVNQLLNQLEVSRPPWLFWLLVFAPFFVLPPLIRRVRHRYPITPPTA
jgi:uncharacterized membrane protein